jgi:hypothetical protein
VSALLHFQAVESLLDTALSCNVYVEGVPENPTLPYVVLWARGGTVRQGDVTAEPDGWREHEFQTTVVAAGSQQALLWRNRVFDALLGVRPTVTGFTVGPLRHVVGGTVGEDEAQPRVVWSPFDVWRCSSVPA